MTSARYGLLMTWARELMEKKVREGGDQKKIEMYFEELVDGADYSATWAALAAAEKMKSKGRT